MAHDLSMVGQRLKADIVSHRVKIIGDKEAIEFLCECEDGEQARPLIWLSSAAAGIARQQLKACGFDPDEHDVQVLEDNPTMLAGHAVTLDVEEYKNRVQYRIPTATTPTKKRMKALSDMLRGAKKDGEDDLPF